MSASPDDPQGTDLLAQEIREEASRLLHHPVAEIKRLEQVVDEGDSAATPLLLFLAVAIALAVIVAVVMVIVFFAYYEG
jgi:CHASE3 domain sensor protein